jgi:hypothetical protein
MSNESERVAILEEKYVGVSKQMDKMDEKIEKIMSNHLPHLQDGMNRIENKLAYYAGGFAVLFTIVEIVIKILK